MGANCNLNILTNEYLRDWVLVRAWLVLDCPLYSSNERLEQYVSKF